MIARAPRRFRIPALMAALAALLWTLGAPGARAQLLSASDVAIYGAAFQAIENEDYSGALGVAAGGENPLAAKIVRWLALTKRGSGFGFADISAFLAANHDWPRSRTLRRRAEEAMPADAPAASALAWFAEFPPLTVTGHMRRIDALLAAGLGADAAAAARAAWIDLNLSPGDEAAFAAAYGQLLAAQDHVDRLDRLLWDGKYEQAGRMLDRVDSGHRRLAEARIRLMRRQSGVDDAVSAVPAALQADPGLIYERLRWRRRADLDAGAREMLDLEPLSPPNARAWWVERSILARRAFRDGLISEAYRIAAGHRQSEGEYYAEAEMLAGWIALRFLDDPIVARDHFMRLYTNVGTPISLARGAYWVGRALEAAGDATNAASWYGVAAGHPQVFYGQLALARLNPDAPLRLPAGPPRPDAAAEAAFRLSELALAAQLMHELGQREYEGSFFWAMLDQAGDGAGDGTDFQLIADLALSLDRPDFAVWAGRRAARRGVFLAAGYPVMPAPPGLPDVEPALIHGLIRQESGFNAAAVSSAGARGLMQLMPQTAARVANALGVAHTTAMLTSDFAHNMLLGATYLFDRLAEFNNSYIMSAAGYNAGPNRVTAWIATYGDPRSGLVDPVDWVELIPFRETRNYVQRVLEGTQVYRVRLGAAPNAGSILVDLTRGAP